MAGKTYTGIDIGTNRLKLAVCSDGVIKKTAVADLPEALVREQRITSYEALAEVLKILRKKAGISCRDAAISLTDAQCFLRRVKLPRMTEKQLQLNLPYEFRDYLTDEKEKYFYDYMLSGASVKAEEADELDLLAAATPKQQIAELKYMLKRAGFKLQIAVPQELAYGQLIRAYEERSGITESQDYCIIDLGHVASRVHFYRGEDYEATRVIESGGLSIDEIISDALGVDVYLARTYKHSNYQNCLALEACMNLFTQLSVEIMRVINFYRFNYPDTEIQRVYVCGGGANIPELLQQIGQRTNCEVLSIAELGYAHEEEEEAWLFPVATGATIR